MFVCVCSLKSFYVHQLGPTLGEDNAYVANGECKDIDMPANGDCTSGWYVSAGNKWIMDPTVTIDCKGSICSLISYIYRHI